MIDASDAIESLNSISWHAIKEREAFPTDESVKKKRRLEKCDDVVERLAPLY